MTLDLQKLLAENPGVNANQLRERLEASRKLHPLGRNRYRYNLVSPFANRFRYRAVEIGGSEDTIRNQV